MKNGLLKSMTAQMYRILVVDDHPMMRDGIATCIEQEPSLEICGEADDVEPALQLFRDNSPDLVIVDISLKSGHGIELIKRIRQRNSTAKILVLSMYDENIYAERSLQAGAMGYLNKQQAGEMLLTAIHTILKGNIFLSPKMTEQILRNRVGRMIRPGENPIDSLSDRELEVLTLIGQGNTTGSIAEKLFLSIHTIDTYREKLKAKLHLNCGAELNRYAAQWVLENG